jgi:hypothetical protein
MPMNDPTKDDGQAQFEQKLRGFHPVAPPSLEIQVRRVPWGTLAVAAGVLLVVALSVVVKRSSHPGDTHPVAIATQKVVPSQPLAAPPMTLGRLNQALRIGDQDLNQVLDGASPRLLPREHHGTVLFELGKE